jgi:hypothetical protein
MLIAMAMVMVTITVINMKSTTIRKRKVTHSYDTLSSKLIQVKRFLKLKIFTTKPRIQMMSES